MADKEQEGKASKLRRKLSKKYGNKTPVTVPESDCPVSSKSATLPLSSDHGMLSLNQSQSQSEGLFSKLRRKFRFGSKGKYDLKTYTVNSPTKPRWLRRKSDETQLQHENRRLSIEGDQHNPVIKSSSVKTTRKAKSDKEEVILIRKDKRISVICKTNNGTPEFIFSNVDNSDEDSSGNWGGMEEDPYATISSVHEEISQKRLDKTPVLQLPQAHWSDKVKSSTLSGKPNKIKVGDDDYPYARIDSNRKKNVGPPPQADTFNALVTIQAKLQNESDYETLEDVRHKKNSNLGPATEPRSVYTAACFRSPSTARKKCASEMDPDYESLEEVKQRCVSSSLPASNYSRNELHPATFCLRDIYDDSAREQGSIKLITSDSDLPSLDGVKCSKSGSVSQEFKVTSTDGSPHLSQKVFSSSSSSSLVSPNTLAPLAPSVDSTLPHDKRACEESSPREECLYDNPNVILRKQGLRSELFSTYSQRGQTLSEPPLIKTPAEEKLVEKLSSLLAPPLPLRNYQKDEVFPSKGERIIISCGGTGRHSWSSHSSKNADSSDSSMLKASTKGPSLRSGHSSEHLPFKTGKETFTAKAQEHQDMFCGKIGSDLYKSRKRSSSENILEMSGHQETKGDKTGASCSEKTAEVQDEDVTRDRSELMVMMNDVLCCSKKCEVNPQNQNISCYSDHLAVNIIDKALTTLKNNQDCKTNQGFNTFNILADHANVDVQDCKTKLPALEFNCAPSLDPAVNSQHAMPQREEDGSQLAPQRSDFSPRAGAQGDPYAKTKHGACTSMTKDVRMQSELGSSGAVDHSVRKADHEEENAKKKENSIPSMSSNSSEQITEETRSAEMYKLQGARPKVKPLPLTVAGSSQLESRKDKAVCKSAPKSHHFEEVLSECYMCDGTTLPPLGGDEGDVSDISPSSSHSFCERKERPSLKVIKNLRKRKLDDELGLQETLYVDPDKIDNIGYELHRSYPVHVKADLTIRKVVKPIFYANPRLLENLISGHFKKEASLDPHYLPTGIFKWARYFPHLAESRDAVEAKLKGFFHFIYKMLVIPSKVKDRQSEVEELQREMDHLQAQISNKLEHILYMPTFQSIRIKLLQTESIDSWQPEKPRTKFTDSQDAIKDSNSEEIVQTHLGVTKAEVTTQQTPPGSRGSDIYKTSMCGKASEVLYEAKNSDKSYGEDLHSDEMFPENPEDFCDLESTQSTHSFPVHPADILEEFLRLSEYPLKCKYCNDDEESDSEDEMIALESYSSIVSGTVGDAFNQVNYINNISNCRALHGELAYSARRRRPRPSRKKVIVPGPDEECQGPKSHLSWKEWVTADGLFKKLVPHICPRLDFQFLLKTYAEFKFFILKSRKRDFDHRGCFVRQFPLNQEHCCRFEEFVFLKLLAEELRYFAKIISICETAKCLFLEEWDVAFSLLKLLKLVLRNIHKMRKSMSRELVYSEPKFEEAVDNVSAYRVKFRHLAFTHWMAHQKAYLEPSELYGCVFRFHVENYENFRSSTISHVLREWKSPQDYLEDPNVLATCRTVFAHTDSRSLELAGMRGPDGDPKPLQEREDFLESMEQLQLKEWYWGPISYEQAALILRDKEDGSFLVRDSSDQKYLLSLSFKSLGEVHHTRIEHAKGLFSFWSQPESLGKARICEFIEKSIQNSRDGRFLYFLRPSVRGTPPLPIRLLTPVSRNFRVATLKHLSRFVVRQTVRKDHLDLLPVPEKVKRYLKDKQYYVEILDDDEWAFDGD